MSLKGDSDKPVGRQALNLHQDVDSSQNNSLVSDKTVCKSAAKEALEIKIDRQVTRWSQLS